MKRDLTIESSRTETQVLVETLTIEDLTVALRETEFEDQDEPDPYSVFG